MHGRTYSAKEMLFHVDFKYVKDMFCVMLFVSCNTEAVCFSQIHDLLSHWFSSWPVEKMNPYDG